MKAASLPFIYLFCMSAPLHAENTSKASDTENFQLAEHVTEVRLRPEPLQWTPVSVTVIKQSEIEATFRRRLEDIGNYVPGMIFDPLGATPQGAAISIRGIHSNWASKGFEPAVAVSIDGVYIGTHSGQNQVLFDFEQIEVARGTQGTFSGVPAEGGTINIRRTKPTGHFGFTSRIGFGDYNRRDVDFVLNFPILAGFAAKLSGSALKTDEADLSNAFNGRRENAEQRYAYSLSLLWNSLDKMSIQYTLDIEDDKSDNPALFNLSDEDSDLVCLGLLALTETECQDEEGIPDTETRRLSNQNFPNDRRFEGEYHTLKILAEYKGLEITSITGIRSTEESSSHDLDATQIDFYSSTFEQEYDQYSTELNILKHWSDDLIFVGGLYWLQTEYDLLRNDLFILDSLNTYAPSRLSEPFIANQARRVDSTQKATIKSFFGHIDYRLNEQWHTDVGIRLNKYDKEFRHHVDAIATLSSSGDTLDLADDDSWLKVSGNIGFRFKVDDEAMIYFRYGIDHTPGGYNDNANSADSSRYGNNQTTQSIELGMKSDWLDDHFRLNLVVYQNYQDDKVEEFAGRTSTGNIEVLFDNQSDLETTGFDVELEYVAMENLYFRGVYGHTNSKYSRYLLPNLATGEIRNLEPTSHRVPSNEFYLSTQYNFPFAEGIIRLFAGYRYVSEYQTNPLMTFAKVPSHTTWNLSAQYDWDNFTLRVFSQNVNDKRYMLNYGDSVDAQIISLPSNLGSIQGISTYAENNRPRYTGFEIIWKN